MQERIKEHDRGIRLTRTQTSAVSEHAHNTGHYPLWNEVKFIDRDPHCYTRRVKEAIHIRLLIISTGSRNPTKLYVDLLSSQILEEHGIIYFNGDHWCITIRTEGQFLLLPEPASLYTNLYWQSLKHNCGHHSYA